MRSEKPGAQTPWMRINQLLAPDERFELHLPHWKGFILTPKHSSQLAALLYLLYQEGIPACIQGRGNCHLPLAEDAVIVSARAFSQITWHEQGVVEVGAGCSLSHLQQFLFERKQEVALEEDPLGSPKRSVAGLILSGQTAGVCYHSESLSDILLGLELVTWEGKQVKWGGKHTSAVAGPALHKLVWGLQALPGVIIKVILKTHPIPPSRLRLAWKFQQKEAVWQQFHALKDFSLSWEYLDVVLSGNELDHGFVFAQISGLSEEMHHFSQACPHYAMASQKGEKSYLKTFLMQQKLQSDWVNFDQPLKKGEYLWIQDGGQRTWLLTSEICKNNQIPFPMWRQRFLASLHE